MESKIGEPSAFWERERMGGRLPAFLSRPQTAVGSLIFLSALYPPGEPVHRLNMKSDGDLFMREISLIENIVS